MNSIDNGQPLSNKEKILGAAIELFAQKGYSGVSMREIAANVNIKAASIYNHYTGKEALLDAIVNYFRSQLHSEVYPHFENENSLNIHTFIQNVVTANVRFFTNPVYTKIGSIILREQFTNEKVRRMLLEELIQKPRDAFASYFSRLMDAGKMTPADPFFAAKEFHAFFIYRFYENSLSPDAPPPDMAKVKQEEDAHIALFLQVFCAE